MSEFRERHYASQDDLRLYYREYGDDTGATPVLCLGGLTRNSRDFHDLALGLGVERRVLCPDYRGRGRSAYDPNWRNYHVRTYLDDIRHLLAVADVHRVAVIGTSLGGIVAMAMAAAYPTLLAGVVLNDVGPEIETAGLARIIEYIRVDRPQPDHERAIETIRAMLPSVEFRDPSVWRKVVENTYRLGDDGMLHFDWDVAIVRLLIEGDEAPPDLWPLFRALKHVPVLALRGELSEILSEATFAAMARVKPDLLQLTVAGTGHTPTLGEPEVRQAIDGFLGRV
jgi:pimeloyl-ACP methyl ester carboxylesterase